MHSGKDDNNETALSCLYFSVFCKDKEFLAFIDENNESYVKCSADTSKEDWINGVSSLRYAPRPMWVQIAPFKQTK